MDKMTFPDTLEEFLNYYGLKDTEEIYTNGALLIPVYRVQQAVEHYFRRPEKAWNEIMEKSPLNMQERIKSLEAAVSEMVAEVNRLQRENFEQSVMIRELSGNLRTNMTPPTPYSGPATVGSVTAAAAAHCPKTYEQLLAQVTALCKERDELKKQIRRGAPLPEPPKEDASCRQQ